MFSLVELNLKKRAERKVAPVLPSFMTDFEDDLPEEYFHEIVDRSIEQFNSNGVRKEKRRATLRSFMKRARGISKLFKNSHQPK